MKYDVITIPPFDKQLKRLSRKYPSLKKDLTTIGRELSDNPFIGFIQIREAELMVL